MKRKSFLERLFYAFFPSEEVTPYPVIVPYEGAEQEFWEWMGSVHPGWSAIYPFHEKTQPRIIHYYAIDGSLVALCVRWPNRNYYYTVEV